MNLALFDLDNTLLAGDSDYEWVNFLVSKGIVDQTSQAANNERFYAQYKAGTLNIDEFMSFQLAPLAKHKRAVLEQWNQEYTENRLRPIMTKQGQLAINKHQQAGDICAVVTATNSFLIGRVVRAFGIDHLIATVPQTDSSGEFTGKPQGVPSFRENKIVRVVQWLESLGLYWGSFEKTWFYSDSLNDLPLMQKVSHPVAVDPDDTLRAHAKSNEWPILTFRELG